MNKNSVLRLVNNNQGNVYCFLIYSDIFDKNQEKIPCFELQLDAKNENEYFDSIGFRKFLAFEIISRMSGIENVARERNEPHYSFLIYIYQDSLGVTYLKMDVDHIQTDLEKLNLIDKIEFSIEEGNKITDNNKLCDSVSLKAIANIRQHLFNNHDHDLGDAHKIHRHKKLNQWEKYKEYF